MSASAASVLTSASSAVESVASSASSAASSPPGSTSDLQASASSALQDAGTALSPEQSSQVSSALSSGVGQAAVAIGQDLGGLLLGQGDIKAAAAKLQTDYDGVKDQLHKANDSGASKLDQDVADIRAAAEAGDTAKVQSLTQKMTQDLQGLITGG